MINGRSASSMPLRSPGEKLIPLYSRVESVIRSKIVSGEFEEGWRLPTKDRFVSHFGVSKITVRNALSRLEERDENSRITSTI
jgi:DNA-binding GntR family transcriptional regulator